MTAKKRVSVDPLARLSEQGFLGYVEDEAESSPYRVLDIAPDDILDSHYQSRERRDRDRIKECEVASRDAPDIQEMLRTAGDRGLRAAKSLRQLDRLDQPEQGILRAAIERAPLIQKFLAGELTTDGVQHAVDAIFTRV